MTCPGPGAGAQARAALIPWYAERPEVLCEEFIVVEDQDSIDLGDVLAPPALSLKVATERAQLWVAENDRPVLIVHQSSVRVATVGKEPPK